MEFSKEKISTTNDPNRNAVKEAMSLVDRVLRRSEELINEHNLKSLESKLGGLCGCMYLIKFSN